MTDPKEDRSKRASEQTGPDWFMHVTKRTEQGLYVTGAKAHMTGGLNSHWICVMPTMNMTEADKDYAVVAMVPADAVGMTYIYSRQSCDMRAMEVGDLNRGNAQFGGREVLVIFDNVFIPWKHVLMDGEYRYGNPWRPDLLPVIVPTTGVKPDWVMCL
ncbi:MAG: 4-hydroxybutyryl-CoA dehydratase/vinylacetyl-CoA-Delta-isomerase [Halieaceae bacterium]|jgi:4-hydroxybutyryl-CoA dehydratase/vinylacetyl-CoA-Delta-isomerase